MPVWGRDDRPGLPGEEAHISLRKTDSGSKCIYWSAGENPSLDLNYLLTGVCFPAVILIILLITIIYFHSTLTTSSHIPN